VLSAVSGMDLADPNNLTRKKLEPLISWELDLSRWPWLTWGGVLFSWWFQSRPGWEQIVIPPARGRLTNRRTAVFLAAAEELHGLGGDLVAGPVLAGIPGLVLHLPDARVLAAVAGVAAQLALDEQLRALWLRPISLCWMRMA
jgi:hypothetical protein